MSKTITALLVAGLFFSCGKFSTPNSPDTAQGSAYPNICQANDGFVMIWYEDDQTIVMSEFSNGTWTEKKTVATSDRFFKNWADLPQIYHAGGNTLALSWLEMSGPGAYDYDVHVSISTDKGATWSEPVVPHRDGVKGEHGFVSFFDNDGKTGLIWLDGRAMMSGGHGHGEGSMRLYSTTIEPTGELGPEVFLDDMVCECCPTAAVNTSIGPIVAFRDRYADETRNIQLSYINGTQSSKPVHDDGWVVPGCPVNGPAMKANGEKVAMAWYTAPNNSPKVNVAFSEDGGVTFDSPIRIDEHKAIGRTDLLWLDEQTILVSWLEEGDESGKLVLKKVNTSGRTALVEDLEISSGRGSGYPKLALTKDHIFVAWTDPEEEGGIRSKWIRKGS